MKRLVVASALVAVLGLVLPLANLVVGPPRGVLGEPERLASPVSRRALALIETKCVNCHAQGGRLPFYAGLPLLHDLVEADIRDARRAFDLTTALGATPSHPPPATLALVERSVRDGSMPPLGYRLLHWDGGLNTAEREILLIWIRQAREGTAATPQSARP